ncbi:MAG: MBL fold metallo-hydrolase [Clostridiales bacterium]|nr:MBL fold metallo-hydrolase [Clostridiales bacterium]
MQILTIPGRDGFAFCSNTYIVYADEGAHACFVVDPGSEREVEGILRVLSERKLKVSHILCTHGHFDHVLGVHDLAAETGAKVAIHESEAKALQSNRLSLAYMQMRSIKPLVPDILLTDGMLISNGEVTLRVLHTPGHTSGSVCFLASYAPICITGDTVFLEDIGATHFPGGHGPTLLASLQKVLALPPQTRLYPGHGPETSVGHELACNPYL